MQVQESNYVRNQFGVSFQITGDVVKSNGTGFFMAKHTFQISVCFSIAGRLVDLALQGFRGLKKITELPVQPMYFLVQTIPYTALQERCDARAAEQAWRLLQEV
jgi:hypothetical protein